MEYLIYRGKVRSFDTQTYLQVYVYVTLCHGSLQVSQNSSKVYGSWTITTTESDTTIDGIGNTNINLTNIGCFSGDAATINSKVEDMNAAIDDYNASAAEGKTCPYTWQADTDGYPTLVKSE